MSQILVDDTTEVQLRQIALDESVRMSFDGDEAKSVIARAKAFYEFLHGKEKSKAKKFRT